MDLVIDPDLWVSRIFPEGVIERWLVADGESVKSNDLLAELRIENTVIEFKSPAAGRLQISAPRNTVIEPGSVIGRVG